jgi:outer membrane protein assembly factor BamB
MTPRSFFPACATIVFCAGSAGAGDWTEFRGPTGQGVVSEGKLPLEWAPDRNIVWKQAIPGVGWSSPIIVSNRIYLTTAVQPAGKTGGYSLRTLCLDAKTGKEIWNVEVFAPGAGTPKGHNKNSQASPTPIFADGQVFVHFGHMGTACLDTDGKIVWKQTDVKYNPVHGNGGSPVLVDNKVVFSCDGGEKPFVVALDRATGKVAWKTDRTVKAVKTFSFSTPLVIEMKGKKQIVLPGSDEVCAYDPADGKEIWRVRYKGYSVVPRPVFGHGMVFVCAGYDPPSTLLAIRVDGTGDVTDTHVAWTMAKNQSVSLTPSPLLDGDELYMVSDRGNVSCLDAKTGKLHWTKKLEGGFSSSPLLAAGRIYCQNEKGKTFVLKAGKTTEELGQSNMTEPTLASFAVADGALFLRTESNLYRIEGK